MVSKEITPSLEKILERLTGEKIPLPENIVALEKLDPENLNLGYSQFNEMLLFLGYDRISEAFFQFLLDRTLKYIPGSSIRKANQLNLHVDKIVEYLLRLFGNIKFGYKKFSGESNEEEFKNWIFIFEPISENHFRQRHKPLFPIKKILSDDTYYLGYIIQREINLQLANNPQNADALNEQKKMNAIIENGIENHKNYLASDHMDIYVATSMRHRHEYLFISRITDEIFSDKNLKNLNVRYFDPTQAYCNDRIDKGISEALMLKRAKCTIYLAQESDTLGKDSELASTLAQGKTVIAYIPQGDKKYVDKLLEDLVKIKPSESRKNIILEQLRIFDPEACWNNKALRDWIDSSDTDEKMVMDLLYSSVRSKYNSRAQTLKETHPLGIQVNLETGVANGVIVTRDIAECALLVRKVLLKEIDFEIEEVEKNQISYLFLKESLTKSVYRVSTGEKLLTNTFWNYYLT